MADAFGELTVAFAQVMGANVASLHLPKSRNYKFNKQSLTSKDIDFVMFTIHICSVKMRMA